MTVTEDVILNPSARLRALISEGSTVKIVPESIPLMRCYRSLNEMYRMACVYRDEQSLEAAFKLYVRFSTMLLEKMPKHPQYKTDSSVEKANAHKKVIASLDEAEKLKKRIKHLYEVEAQELREEQERRLAEIKEQQAALPPPPPAATPSAPPLPEPAKPTDVSFPIVDTHSIEYPEINAPKSVTPAVFDTAVTPAEAPSVPLIDRSTKPSVSALGNTYLPTNKYGFRDVVVPTDLIAKFLNSATPNTQRKIETGGVLCGQLSQNKFMITHVVIPKQSGGPDSCTTEKEEEVFAFQDAHDLITVGWIHTHPTQTAFLSSVDLHTHGSYQMLLPEAIAIVCSPKYQETGIFMLTEQGMRQIESCREVGFHPHQQNPPLFENCPHAASVEGLTGNVIDLR